jgi:hypothetical protein
MMMMMMRMRMMMMRNQLGLLSDLIATTLFDPAMNVIDCFVRAAST